MFLQRPLPLNSPLELNLGRTNPLVCHLSVAVAAENKSAVQAHSMFGMTVLRIPRWHSCGMIRIKYLSFDPNQVPLV